MVPAVDRDEGPQRREALARPESAIHREADRERCGSGPRTRDRERDQSRAGLHVAHRDPEVSPPHVHDRRAPSVVGGVHALVVVLGGPDLERQDPVGTALVRAALVGPEGGLDPGRRRGHGVAAIRPAADADLPAAAVRVHGLHDRDPREVVVEGHVDGLADVARTAVQSMPPAAADHVGERLLVLPLEPEVREFAGVRAERLRRGEGTHRDVHPVGGRHDAASQRLVELQTDAPPFEPHDRRVGRRRLQGQKRARNGARARMRSMPFTVQPPRSIGPRPPIGIRPVA